MHYLLLLLPLLGLALFISLPWKVALPLYVILLVGSIGIYWKIIQAQRGRPVTGKRAMIGDQALVVRVVGDNLEVDYEGETWQAVSPHPLHQGQRVIIEGVEGLTLRVKPAPQPADDGPTAPLPID